MENSDKKFNQVEDALDARGALLPENIKNTALDAIYRAFCTIRACAHDEPRRAGVIANAFHNLPRVLQGGDHQEIRKETLLAIQSLAVPVGAEVNAQ